MNDHLDAYLDRLLHMVGIADAKALAVITLNTLILTVVLSFGAARLVGLPPFGSPPLQLEPEGWYLVPLVVTAMSGLGAFYCSALVLMPRTKPVPVMTNNPYFFGTAKKLDFGEFHAKAMAVTSEGILEQCYQVARIVTDKFFWTGRATWCTYGALLGGIVTMPLALF